MKISKQNIYRDKDLTIDDKGLRAQLRRIDQDMLNLFTALQGRTRFGTGTSGDRGENIDGYFLSITTNATPDTEDAFSHGLGSVPIGYIVLSKDKAGHIYAGGSSNTSTNIYLRSDVASVTATLFILK